MSTFTKIFRFFNSDFVKAYQNKLRSYALMKDKTVTQIVEDWVDRLPNTLSVKNNADPNPCKPTA